MTETWKPEVDVVKIISVQKNHEVPSDALLLFNGTDLNQWQDKKGNAAAWIISDGEFTVKKGTGDLITKKEFKDFQLHVEWRIPMDISGAGQARGNSGIFLQGKYELQVLDSYQNKTYSNGQAGSIYKQSPPLKNAMKSPGEWNVYDIIFTAPRFREDGRLFSAARVTVLHNNVLIQNNFEILGSTEYIGLPKYTTHETGPIILQDHGDPSKPISFRNIWIREV